MSNSDTEDPSVRVNRIMATLEKNVLAIGRMEFSKEEYDLSFSAGTVRTPLGIVKISEHQFEKMSEKKRKGFFSAMYLTLSDPIIILHDIRFSEERQEKEESRIYIKSIRKLWDLKISYMISVVVIIYGIAISISNGPRERNRIIELIKSTNNILYEK